jgi:hypothetical protein
MAQKKKIVKKKITKQKGQVIKQTVNVNVSGGVKSKSKSKSGGRGKKKVVGTPPENRQSSGYILPSIPSWQLNPSNQPQFQKIEDRQLLIEDLKRQFPLLGYTPQQPQQQAPRITQGEPSFTVPEEEALSEYSFAPPPSKPFIEEVLSEYTQSSSPISLIPPPVEKISRAKTEEEKMELTNQKLARLGFPDSIAPSGSYRSSDIRAVVELYLKHRNEVNQKDLERKYKITSKTVSKYEQLITGIQKEKRKSSKIPTLEEYNLV